MNKFKKNDTVRAVDTLPLGDNEVAPPLKMDENYTVKDICVDSAGNQHLDVGLKSRYNYVRSFETQEELPKGDSIHWCHPSRFELV